MIERVSDYKNACEYHYTARKINISTLKKRLESIASSRFFGKI